MGSRLSPGVTGRSVPQGSLRSPSRPPFSRSSHPSLSLSLLLALSALALPNLASAQVPPACPVYDTGVALTSLLDVSDPSNLVVAFPGAILAFNASSANVCAQRAATFPCSDLGFSTAFYLYSASGFGARPVTCLVGAKCGQLKAGSTSVTYGYVDPICPSPPPPGKAVSCPTPGKSISVSIDAKYRKTVSSYFTDNAPKILAASSEAECIAFANRFTCRGSPSAFYIYTPDSSIRETDIVFGNCAFGQGCTGLIEGNVKASVGILPKPDCKFPPPSPPPPPSLEIPCPDRDNTAVQTVSLDTSDPFSLASGPFRVPAFANTSSLLECAALAATYPCDAWFPADSGFFIYAPAGITIKNWEDGSPTSYSCLYGAWCGRLQKGKTKAQIGYVAPRCASPPPPGRPVVCPTGGEPQKVSIDAIRRSTVDGYFEGSPPTIDFVESAQECRKKALAARCRGERVSFFLYTPDSSFREGDILFGNCAFGSACTGLIEGTDTAIVGNLEEPCPPPPELLKCPEDSSTKQETALLDLSSPFELARGPWRLGSLSNATSKDACAALASKVPCDEWFPALTGFFVYVPEGVRVDGGVLYANCVTGAFCGNLPKGRSKAVYGYVQPRCPAPPPPAAPVPCAKGAELKAVFVDAAKYSTASTYFNGEVRVTYEESARACRLAAQRANCDGFTTRAFLYVNNTNFRDGDALYGNCMFGSQCKGLLAGRIAAVVGNVAGRCPAPPPPPTPPPRVNPKLCIGGFPSQKFCSCPRFARCQRRSFCRQPWQCRCLGEYKKRVEAKNGTLLACLKSLPQPKA